MTECDIQTFVIPSTWVRLQELELSDNQLTSMPGPFAALELLSSLSLSGQRAAFQLDEPMFFLTQLQKLQSVNLLPYVDHTWEPSSHFHLMQARMLTRCTPGCNVKLFA